MTWQKTRINVDSDLTKSERLQIGSEIIDFIVARTQSGKNKNNESFPKYTKEYAAKTGKTKVNLVDDFDMLSALEVLSDKKGSILIGYKNGTKENAKAEGNQTGSYGRSPNASKARPFIGLTEADLQAILDRFENE